MASIKPNTAEGPVAIVDDITFESILLRSRVLTAILDGILSRHALPGPPKQAVDLAE